MKKTTDINLRICTDDKEYIRKEAKKMNLSMTQYILNCVYKNNPDKMIFKKDLAADLVEIATLLDCAELKDSRTAKEIRKKFKKLWELL